MSRPVDTAAISPLVLSRAREALARLKAVKAQRWPEGHRPTREQCRAKMAAHRAAVAELMAFGGLVVDAITQDPPAQAEGYAARYASHNPRGARRLRYWAETTRA